MEVYRQRVENDLRRSPMTMKFRQSGLRLLEKYWHALDARPSGLSLDDVQLWIKQLHEAPQFVPPGAKTPTYSKRRKSGDIEDNKISASKHNCALDALRGVLDVAVEFGLATNNVARDKFKRRSQKPKRVKLPSLEEFRALMEHLSGSPNPRHREALWLIQFCAYTGARISEAGQVCWRDVEEQRLWLDRVKGDIDRQGRAVPLITPTKKLLESIRTFRVKPSPNDRILGIRECGKTLTSICAEKGLQRLTHHDLRHLFATRCIESGVDIPTVARWLGHKDGGALAMRVYGHLRDDHSAAMAEKVDF